MELEIKEKINKNYILEEYAKKYKPEELTADGIPNTETQIREMKEKDEEINKLNEENKQKIYNREMIQRVKLLCLLKMGKSIFTNTFDMKIKEREQLQELMWEYNDKYHFDIIKEFNEKIGDVLDDDKLDFSKVPVYNYH
jgi:hypothetical protein